MRARGPGPIFRDRRDNSLLRPWVNIWMVRRKARKKRIHLRRHTATRISTFDARDRLQKGRSPSLHNPALDSQWNPQACPARKLDSGPHHTDDRMTLSIQPDHLPNDVAVRSKMFAPDPVRNHH